MDHHVDIQKCLVAFARILEKGERLEDSYLLDGITARSMDDGYTVTLSNRDCLLTIYFHNKFGLESTSQTTMDTFIKHLYQIAEQ
ncbi:DUF3081 family protein [Endozoicomonas elysicola]|uniref:DUF3081 domain-containing protein n=1 Tax=Endozoicomonas elysicola TaxID=305900 RepID=A0A081KCM6_9GAMM|nr:DUF3081 family protein [Endozoicomonas elysicola]KEI71902.1 hypothetical protein GV64_15205 [Endozoicomonas elysicola]